MTELSFATTYYLVIVIESERERVCVRACICKRVSACAWVRVRGFKTSEQVMSSSPVPNQRSSSVSDLKGKLFHHCLIHLSFSLFVEKVSDVLLSDPHETQKLRRPWTLDTGAIEKNPLKGKFSNRWLQTLKSYEFWLLEARHCLRWTSIRRIITRRKFFWTVEPVLYISVLRPWCSSCKQTF